MNVTGHLIKFSKDSYGILIKFHTEIWPKILHGFLYGNGYSYRNPRGNPSKYSWFIDMFFDTWRHISKLRISRKISDGFACGFSHGFPHKSPYEIFLRIFLMDFYVEIYFSKRFLHGKSI